MAQDPYKYFRVEARDLLDQMGRGVLELEERGGAAPAEVIARLLRLAHTLKGAARVVKQRDIADRAHAIEDVLGPYRDGGGPLPRASVDAILALLDGVGVGIAGLIPPPDAGDAAGARAPGDAAGARARAPAADSGPQPAPAAARPPADEALRTVRADVGEMDALLEAVSETHARLASARKTLDGAARARHLVDLLARQLAPRAGGVDAASRPAAEGITADRAYSMAEELRALFGGWERELGTSFEQMERELVQTRDLVEQLRLVPAAALFASCERTARDGARTLDRRVTFEGRGRDVRLDAHTLGEIQGAVLQLVRNAVAHGIEPEAERRAAGKPAAGKVAVEVVRRGRRVTFRCSDDGRGVDLAAVKRAAVGKGVEPAALEARGADDVLRLLLRAGISTSASVTEVSGRGIGLDVVREAAERLGGEITLETAPGQGATFTISVPLSMVSIDALAVEAAGLVVTVPMDSVRCARRIAAVEISRTAGGRSVVHDGQPVPLLSLSALLASGGRRTGSEGEVRSCSALIVEGRGGELAAVSVDRLLGARDVVLRPLPELACADPIVAGASLDVEGNPQLVLDPDGLVERAYRQTEAGARAAAPERDPVLVIDDSLTTRMLEQSILESAGYTVDVAASAEEGMETARRKRYALFLVDVEMPGMDGFTFVERTRADPELSQVPAILVTSRAAPADRQRGKDVGAAGYIIKSEFDQVELLGRIRQLVG